MSVKEIIGYILLGTCMILMARVVLVWLFGASSICERLDKIIKIKDDEDA